MSLDDLPEVETKKISDEEWSDWMDEPVQKRGPRFETLDTKRMLSEFPPPVPWMVEPLVARGSVTLLTGKEGEGKSMLALSLAGRVAEGRSLADMSCRQGRVLYIDAENGRHTVHTRLHLLGLPAWGVTIKIPVEFFTMSRHLPYLNEVIADEKPELVILDSLRSLWPDGDENNSGMVEALLASLRQTARENDCGVLVLHHLAKTGNSAYRGSTALGAGAEIVVTMRRCDKDHKVRILDWRKCRLAEEPDPRFLRFTSYGSVLEIVGDTGTVSSDW